MAPILYYNPSNLFEATNAVTRSPAPIIIYIFDVRKNINLKIPLTRANKVIAQRESGNWYL